MKLAVFDIDGTLVMKGRQRVPESAIRALHLLQENGYILVLASGRGIAMIDTGLFGGAVFPYIIANNGASITERDGTVHILCGMETRCLDRLLEDARRLDGAMEICYYRGNEVLYGYEKIREMAVYFVGEETFENAYKVPIQGEPINAKAWIPPELMDYYKTAYPDLRFTTTGYGFVYDVVDSRQSKGQALAWMREHLDVEEIIAFGDDDNDIDMIETADFGVAMGNASPGLKAAADYVTADIEEDGVWKAVLRIREVRSTGD